MTQTFLTFLHVLSKYYPLRGSQKKIMIEILERACPLQMIFRHTSQVIEATTQVSFMAVGTVWKETGMCLLEHVEPNIRARLGGEAKSG